MIIANKISKKFDNKNILNDFNYKFNDTGLYLIVGENGSGKTTLLNIISGLVTPDDGSIIYNNVICNKKEYEYLRREEISYIFQNTNLINSLSVRDNLKIAYLAKYKSIDGFEASSSEILEKLYLSDRIDQKS